MPSEAFELKNTRTIKSGAIQQARLNAPAITPEIKRAVLTKCLGRCDSVFDISGNKTIVKALVTKKPMRAMIATCVKCPALVASK